MSHLFLKNPLSKKTAGNLPELFFSGAQR